MARKKDPIVNIVRFFETASPEIATMALALGRDIVKRRTDPAKPKPRKRAKTAPAPVPTPSPIPEGKGNPPPSKPYDASADRAPKRRRRAEPADLALPGIGPSTVGDE